MAAIRVQALYMECSYRLNKMICVELTCTNLVSALFKIDFEWLV